MWKWVTIWFCAVAVLSLSESMKGLIGTRGDFHAAGHILVFFISGLLGLATAKTLFARISRTVLLILACAGIELSQSLGYHNAFEWDDLLLDCLALSLALVLVHLVAVTRADGPKYDREAVISVVRKRKP